jgi:putative lipoic acid-binding regulatory protein
VSDDTKDTLLTFPTDFTIKVIGKDNETFKANVLKIVRQHVASLPDDAVQYRQSEKGNYRAMSITMHITSKEQLDDIYRALSSAPDVLMVL